MNEEQKQMSLIDILEIDSSSEENVQKSFDKIAKHLLLQSALKVNSNESELFELTELEFYFFKYDVHEDRYTHEHDRAVGQWRHHREGIDITFQSNKFQDGGVLIRGVRKFDNKLKRYEYVNGPLRILDFIFKSMGNVNDQNNIQLINKALPITEIRKTFRHLPENRNDKFYSAKYRYIKWLGELKDLTIHEIDRIKVESIPLL